MYADDISEKINARVYTYGWNVCKMGVTEPLVTYPPPWYCALKQEDLCHLGVFAQEHTKIRLSTYSVLKQQFENSLTNIHEILY